MVADGEELVGDGGGVPDGVAGGVAVPVCVFYGGVAEEVYFVGGVIDVDIYGDPVDCAVDFVGGVFDAPDPESAVSIRGLWLVEKGTNIPSASKVSPTSFLRP